MLAALPPHISTNPDPPNGAPLNAVFIYLFIVPTAIRRLRPPSSFFFFFKGAREREKKENNPSVWRLKSDTSGSEALTFFFFFFLSCAEGYGVASDNVDGGCKDVREDSEAVPLVAPGGPLARPARSTRPHLLHPGEHVVPPRRPSEN